MYWQMKYIATIIILLLSQLYIYVYDHMPYTVYTATDSLVPSIPIYPRKTYGLFQGPS